MSNTLNRQHGFRAKQNRPGTPYAAGDAYTRERASDLQKWPTVWLTGPQAMVVARTLVEVAEDREWLVLRAAVMANHVHVVLSKCPLNGPAVRRILKGNIQAKLSAAAGASRRWWTAGGSNRRRVGERSILETIRYVADQEGKLAEVIENVVLGDAHRRG